MDRISPEERSRIMSHIRSKDTKPEKRLRSLLHRLGFRFRLHRKDLPGTPDIVLPKYRTVIFVHGCFWHQHPGCKKATLPRSNVEFWKNKLEKNIERDKEVEKKLIETGWNVIVIWECEIKKHIHSYKYYNFIQKSYINNRTHITGSCYLIFR